MMNFPTLAMYATPRNFGGNHSGGGQCNCNSRGVGAEIAQAASMKPVQVALL